MTIICPERDPGFASSTVHGERAQIELLRQVVKLCPARRNAVDAGAHIGLWTRNLAPSFERVYAFEPVRENYECLRDNTRAEGLEHVQIFHRALGATAGVCSMKMPQGGNSGCWHVSSGDEVVVSRLDMFDLQNVDLIKMDVEGFEGAVVRGAMETIQRCRPVVVFEDNGTGPKYFSAEWVDPKPLLASMGYTLRFTWRRDVVWIPSR